MKTFGLSILAAVVGYLVGLFGGMVLIEAVSSNTHDQSVEAAMTGAFVFGPLAAILAVVAMLAFRLRQSSKVQP
jgi:divalent metal cation (Fe/Co/Zn/Cd) transporter